MHFISPLSAPLLHPERKRGRMKCEYSLVRSHILSNNRERIKTIDEHESSIVSANGSPLCVFFVFRDLLRVVNDVRLHLKGF